MSGDAIIEELLGFARQPLVETDDETIKDLLGSDYMEPMQPLEGDVHRHDRWLDVKIGDYRFCISYLTPVAMISPTEGGVIRTDRNWSAATAKHIKKWLDYVGFYIGFDTWEEVKARFPKTIPQEELIAKFNELKRRVNWNKHQARKFGAVPYDKLLTGLRSDSEDRVRIEPTNESEEEAFGIKDLEQSEPPVAGPTTVSRKKSAQRWKAVDTERFNFCISYLTPVAYWDKQLGIFYCTSKQWSPTTNQHIQDWKSHIRQLPVYANNPDNLEKTEYSPNGYVRYPSALSKKQVEISALFRSLIPTMQMTPRSKRRMYHVDPRMRPGSRPKPWISGHLKHHDTGVEGLPRPGEKGFEEFFSDFDPDDFEEWDWQGSSYRNQEPYEPGEERT